MTRNSMTAFMVLAMGLGSALFFNAAYEVIWPPSNLAHTGVSPEVFRWLSVGAISAITLLWLGILRAKPSEELRSRALLCTAVIGGCAIAIGALWSRLQWIPADADRANKALLTWAAFVVSFGLVFRILSRAGANRAEPQKRNVLPVIVEKKRHDSPVE